jgi:sugar phosphate isomerase/epimerase
MHPHQTVSRRRFLSAGVSAATLATFPGHAAGARKSKLKFGLTSYQWGADWDIPTMIANCTKAKAMAVELRTSAKYKHGVEPEISPERRREVKKMFADSPIKLIGINSAARFDATDPAALRAAIESAKAHVILAHDTGATGVRVFPNDFHKGVPEEQTLAQVAKSLNEVGKFARDYNQMVRLENHGGAGELVNLRRVMDQVDQPNVRIKLNGDARDNRGEGFAKHFALVKDKLGDTLHMRMHEKGEFPYQLQWDLLVDAGWDGWCFVEESVKVPDRVQALIEERQMWEGMIAKSVGRG